MEQEHRRDIFDCGIPGLNMYLKKFALRHHEKGVAKTYVLVDTESSQDIIGYVTLSLCEMDSYLLPPPFSKKYSKSVPAAKLSRLAIDAQRQQKGLGEMLMVFAMEKAVLVSEQIGIIGFVADCGNEYATQYFKQYGAMDFPSKPFIVFLPIKTIFKAFMSNA